MTVSVKQDHFCIITVHPHDKKCYIYFTFFSLVNQAFSIKNFNLCIVTIRALFLKKN